MTVLNATGENFENEVLKSELPVLVDFWAEWCGPCRMVGPVVEELAEELQGKLKVVKVNVDQAQDVAGRYKIMSIPTMILFKDGEVVEQIVGAVSKGHLAQKINAKL
jgi:thioredoxin 1